MSLFSKPVVNIAKTVERILDDVITSKEEKIKAYAEIERELQKEATLRHQTDMQSDSWLSKNIRPMALIFILLMYSLLSMLDGNVGEFKINSEYVTLLGEWGKIVMSFYFTARAAEKITSIIKKNR